MTESLHRTLVVTKLPRSVPALLTAVRAILTAMEGNPTFPSPSPPLAEVAAAAGPGEDVLVPGSHVDEGGGAGLGEGGDDHRDVRGA